MSLIPNMITRMKSTGQAVPPEKRLSRDAVLSLVIHSAFQFGSSMAGVFLNLYLWRLTESLAINGLYNIVNFTVGPFAFALGGWMAKRKDRLFTYRVGIALIALFYLAVVLVQEQLVDYYLLFAVFNGIGGGFYWIGYLTLMYDVSTEQNRIRYLAFNTIFFTLAGLAGPALAGFVIARSSGLSGYLVVFSFAFIMLLAAAVGSLRISSLASRSKRYFLGFTPLLMGKNKVWLRGLFGFFILGLFQGIMLFLPNILLFRAMPREDLVGYLGILFSSVSVGMGVFLSRYAREEKRRLYLTLVATGYVFGASLLLLHFHLYTVIGFLLLYNLFAPMQNNSLTSFYYGLTSRLPLKGQLRIESIVIREAFLNLGRVVSISLLIFISSDLDPAALTLVLMAAAATQFAMIFLITKPRAAGGEG